MTSSFSTIASMTTSARPMPSPFGIGDQARLGGVALRLGLELAARTACLCAAMPLAICSALTSCSVTSMPRGDAPAGDVGAHGAGADHVHAQRLEGEVLRRLRLQHLRQLEHAAQVARGVATPSAARRRASRPPSCRRGCRRASRTGRSAGTARDSDPRAPSWRSRRACLLGEQAARRPLAQQRLAEAGAASTCACCSTALRAAQRSVAAGSATSSSTRPMPRAARGADHRARQHRLHGGQRAGLADRARGAVEAGEDAELHLGEAERVASSRVAMR